MVWIIPEGSGLDAKSEVAFSNPDGGLGGIPLTLVLQPAQELSGSDLS